MVKKDNYDGQVEVRFGLTADGGPNMKDDSRFSIKMRHKQSYPENRDVDENPIILPESLAYYVDIRLPDGSWVHREIEGAFIPKVLLEEIPAVMQDSFNTSALLAEKKGYLKPGKYNCEFFEKFNEALSFAQDWFFVDQCNGYVGLFAPGISDEGKHPQEGYRIFSIKD